MRRLSTFRCLPKGRLEGPRRARFLSCGRTLSCSTSVRPHAAWYAHGRGPKLIARAPSLTDAAAPCTDEVEAHASLEIQCHRIAAKCNTPTNLLRISRERLDSLSAHPNLRPFIGLSHVATNRGPLLGVPFCSMDDMASSALSRAAADAGGTFIGQTHSSPSCFHATVGVGNPYNPDLSAGGSTSGSAVNVATGVSSFAVGSNGGGSVGIPAAFCGISGLQLEPGLRLRAGSRTYARDGLLARGPKDLALVLDAITGSAGTYRDAVNMPRALRILVASAISPRQSGPLIPGYPRTTDHAAPPDHVERFDEFVRELADLATASDGALRVTVQPPDSPVLPDIVEPFMVHWMGDALRRAHEKDDPALHRLAYRPMRALRKECPTVEASAAAELQRAREALLALGQLFDVIVTPAVLTAPWSVLKIAPTVPVGIDDAIHEVTDGRFNPFLPLVDLLQAIGGPQGCGLVMPVHVDGNHLPVACHIMSIGDASNVGCATSQVLFLASIIESCISGRVVPPYFPSLWEGDPDLPLLPRKRGMMANGLNPVW